MSPNDDLSACIANLRRWAITERRRAAAESVVAAYYEREAARSPGSFGADRLKRGAMHREAQARHLAAARLHERLAARLWTKATAATLGVPSIAVVLLDSQQAVATATVSNATARAAHDLEAMMGEGPVHTLAGDSPQIRIQAPALHDRWPLYGPALTEVGVRSVLAVPLLPGGGLGALCVYSRQPEITDGTTAAANRITATLSPTMLHVPQPRDSDDDAAVEWFVLADDQAIVHQAAGMVSVQCCCAVDDAVALLRARAYASGQPVTRIADAVVRGDLRLDGDWAPAG